MHPALSQHLSLLYRAPRVDGSQGCPVASKGQERKIRTCVVLEQVPLNTQPNLGRTDFHSENSIFINYLHNKYNSSCSKIASVVEISTNDTKKASDISDKLKVVAMQVSAMKPMGLNEESIDPKILDDEKDIILKQIENTPDDKKDQIVKGKLNKFIKENTLMGQALITDPKNTVSNYISDLSKSNNLDLNITSMDLYTI